jgi:hypothetical protein
MNKVYTWILLGLIAIAGIIVFSTAVDCVINWQKGIESSWFEKASFWYLIFSIPLIVIGMKVSFMEDPYNEEKK